MRFKRFTVIILTLAVAVTTILRVGVADRAKAAAQPVLAVEAIGGNQVSGYFNSTNYAFRAVLVVDPSLKLEKSQLMIDSEEFDEPIYGTRISDSEIEFLSQTILPEQLQAVVGEGSHAFSVSVSIEGELDVTEYGNVSIIADYTSPSEGGFVFELKEVTHQYAIVGDTIMIRYQPKDILDEVDSISATINNKKIDWEKLKSADGKDYLQANYIIASGDVFLVGSIEMEDLIFCDKAGNQTLLPLYTAPIDFVIDPVLPTLKLTSKLNTENYIQGDTIIFEGTTEPANEVILSVNSNPLEFKTIAGADGSWRIAFDTTPLEIGEHSATISVISYSGNKLIYDLGKFAISYKQTENITVAQTDNTESQSDVSAPISYKTVSSDELSAKTVSNELLPVPDIGSGESVKSTVNWSAWILLLAIVVLASALATAGYYGYAWIGAKTTEDIGNTLREKNVRPQERKISDKLEDGLVSDHSDHKAEVSQSDKKEPPVTRW